jgi:hypothetical protein
MPSATDKKLMNARFKLVTNGYKNVKIAKSQKSGKGVKTSKSPKARNPAKACLPLSST